MPRRKRRCTHQMAVQPGGAWKGGVPSVPGSEGLLLPPPLLPPPCPPELPPPPPPPPPPPLPSLLCITAMVTAEESGGREKGVARIAACRLGPLGPSSGFRQERSALRFCCT